MLNFNHLTDAANAAGLAKSKIAIYIWHLGFSIKQAVLLTIMAVVSVVHGIFPFLFDFWLMETFLSMVETLKKKFPNYKK